MSVRTSETVGTARTENTISTYLNDDFQEEEEKINTARTKESYKVRFFDGKAPGTADDGKVNKGPNQQNQNWGRTGLLLIEGGTIILRVLFDEKIKQTANGNLSAYLKIPANYQTLFDLYQGKVISPLQWDVLYPTSNANVVNSLELDIIMLHILVIHTCQFKGDVLMDIQRLEKRRDIMYDFAKDAKITDAKFETEYDAVGAVLAKLTVTRELGRDVENRIKNMVKNLKTITMTKEEIITYLGILKRWYLCDIDIRKAVKELKPLLKNGQGETKKAKDILAKLKMLAEDDSNKLHDMKDIKEELEKLASDLEGIKKKKTKLKTVLNILSVLTPRFSQPFNIESIGLSIPSLDRWNENGVQFVLSFYCQGQLHVYTKSTKFVVEAKLKILLGDERFPEGEIAAIKALDSSKLREQLITDLHLAGIATLAFKDRSFLIVPIESTEQGYRKLMETVKVPVWKKTVSNVFQTEQVKSHLHKGGCLCISGGGDPTVMLDIRCRGSDIALSSLAGEVITSRPSPYKWKEGTRTFVVKKYFLGKNDDNSVKGPQCVIVDLTVKKGTKVDHVMEDKFSSQMNDKNFNLKTLLAKEGVASVTCDQGKSSITIAFSNIAAVKEFHDQFRYEDIKTFVNKLFEEVKIQKVFGNASFNIYVDVIFSIPEVECKGLPEPAAPTAPRLFKVTDITTTSVTLTWEEPLTNGGVDITGYPIERYDLGEKKWMKVGVADPNDRMYQVTNLLTSHEYYFRITAENLAGTSPKVESPEPVLLSRTKVVKQPEIVASSTEEKSKLTPRFLPKPKLSTQLSNDSKLSKAGNATDTSNKQHRQEAEPKEKKIEENPVEQDEQTTTLTEKTEKLNIDTGLNENKTVNETKYKKEIKNDIRKRESSLKRPDVKKRESSLKRDSKKFHDSADKQGIRIRDGSIKRSKRDESFDSKGEEKATEQNSAVNHFSKERKWRTWCYVRKNKQFGQEKYEG
ncbi:TTN [Mytilus coruscus]|uniref:TTN n=1 Tax=Mytilus coruscus TaxID=42192 RepID=A0A6J8A8A8_MYTCO|nr:TTN [Mytilus coruscus]